MAHEQLGIRKPSTENLSNRALALRLLTEHILRTDWSVKVDTSNTGTLLASVVLFLHHQIQLPQSPVARTVLLLIVANRLQQSNHRHTAFVL